MDCSTGQKPGDDNKAMKMMERMGFAHGEGLGKNKQGITVPIELRSRIGRRGLGIETEQQHKEFESILLNELENKPIEEVPEWLKCSENQRKSAIDQLTDDEWVKLGIPITKDEQFMKQDRYCSSELITELIEAKNVFDTMGRKELEAARSRANPYETVKAGFFQNRAAMKTANLDRIFEWGLSWEFDRDKRIAKNPLNGNARDNVDRFSPLFYFADVCAGPGGFSEYMLWRKAFYNSKGFGFTLTGKDDFKLDRFKAASADYFETFYGVNGDGDVTNPDNLESLEKFVHDRIHSGVHLVMCDGGFSVDGQENLQEVLSKRLYLCQFAVGLALCRAQKPPIKEEIGEENATAEKGGNFLCKLFDVFTPFSMGLIYLMYLSFDRISLHKPITSRPANSERYIFCENMNLFGSTKVKKYLMEVNKRMEGMDRKKEDIMELVPEELMSEDDTFMAYIRKSIEQTARRQVFYLRKYKHFAANPGTFDQDQAKLREGALKYWELPDIERPKEISNFHRKRTAQQMNEEVQLQPNQRPETANELFKRHSGDRIHFPIRRQISRFTEDVLSRCSDFAELRALLLPKSDSDGPVLLVAVMGNGALLMMHRRNGLNFEAFQSVKGTFPTNTVLLAMCTTLYEDVDKSMHPLGTCLWVLDAAVLNGDDVAHFGLKARNAAVRKFAAAVNRLYIRRPIFERNPNKGRRGGMEFSRYTDDLFSELIVAEPMRLKALTEQKFTIRKHRGCRVAFFPVWARNDRRDSQNPPKKYFLECQGVRVQNVLNRKFVGFDLDGLAMMNCAGVLKSARNVCRCLLNSQNRVNGTRLMESNFMLTRNELNQEEIKPRFGITAEQNQCTTFYDSFLGYFSDDTSSSYPDGHPHSGAITFNWSWAPDFSSNFTVEHILDPEVDQHPSGLTMSAVRRLIGNAKTAMKREETKQVTDIGGKEWKTDE